MGAQRAPWRKLIGRRRDQRLRPRTRSPHHLASRANPVTITGGARSGDDLTRPGSHRVRQGGWALRVQLGRRRRTPRDGRLRQKAVISRPTHQQGSRVSPPLVTRAGSSAGDSVNNSSAGPPSVSRSPQIAQSTALEAAHTARGPGRTAPHGADRCAPLAATGAGLRSRSLGTLRASCVVSCRTTLPSHRAGGRCTLHGAHRSARCSFRSAPSSSHARASSSHPRPARLCDPTFRGACGTSPDADRRSRVACQSWVLTAVLPVLHTRRARRAALVDPH